MLGKQYKARLCLAVAGVLCASSVFAGIGLEASAAVNAPAVTSAGGWLESAYVTWSASEGADGYNVYVTGENGEALLDDELIRVYSNGSGQQYYRADALGLSSGNYSFKVVPVENGKEQAGARRSFG